MQHQETMQRLNRAVHVLDAAYGRIAKRHGLTFNALMMLYAIDEAQGITQKQLCDALQLPKSTVHSILLDFIKREHVTLVQGENKKEKSILFTSAGRAYCGEILRETQRFEEGVLSALGEETCAFLVDTAQRLEAIIKQTCPDETGGRP